MFMVSGSPCFRLLFRPDSSPPSRINRVPSLCTAKSSHHHHRSVCIACCAKYIQAIDNSSFSRLVSGIARNRISYWAVESILLKSTCILPASTCRVLVAVDLGTPIQVCKLVANSSRQMNMLSQRFSVRIRDLTRARYSLKYHLFCVSCLLHA